MLERILDFPGKVYHKIKTLRKKIAFILLAILTFIAFIYIPNGEYTIAFLLFFGLLTDRLMAYLIPLKVVQRIDIEKDETEIWEISNSKMNEYKIEDMVGQPGVLKWDLKADKDTVVFVDNIDLEKKVLRVFPIFTDLSIIVDAKATLSDIKQKMNDLLNHNIKLSDQMDYKATEIAAGFYMDNKLLDMVSNMSPVEIQEQPKSIEKPMEVELVDTTKPTN